MLKLSRERYLWRLYFARLKCVGGMSAVIQNCMYGRMKKNDLMMKSEMSVATSITAPIRSLECFFFVWKSAPKNYVNLYVGQSSSHDNISCSGWIYFQVFFVYLIALEGLLLCFESVAVYTFGSHSLGRIVCLFVFLYVQRNFFVIFSISSSTFSFSCALPFA